jgi:hypothetical protein
MACGCTITTPGFYRVGKDLGSSDGVTAKGGCIDIKAAKVVLDVGQPGHQRSLGYNITGAGGGTPTGVGIHILKGSNGNFLELISDITGWDVRLLVEGNNNIVEGFAAGPFNGLETGRPGLKSTAARTTTSMTSARRTTRTTASGFAARATTSSTAPIPTAT